MKDIFILPVAFSFLIASFANVDQVDTPSTPPVSKPQDSLFREIAHMDSVLFNAFNSRDTVTLKQVFSKELEFYHDKSGLTNYSQNMEAFKNIFSAKNDLRRSLVPGSLKVYPVKDFGAIQEGQHTFCHTENGKPDCGTFKFLHIWKRDKENWKLFRIISYDH